ncbi:MAG: hypothetical protein FJW34_01030 [Acidobacteria bacterium]|nr:hypothetical protein [Acidobacteriota bacterium]
MALLLATLACGRAAGATFGSVVPIRGHGADVAVDERRGVVYVANLTANRIEVVSLADRSLKSPFSVPWQPNAMALSPDGRYLVVTHFWNFQPPSPAPVTVLDLDARLTHHYTLGSLGLGVAFGAQSQALIVTAQDFRLLDPASGRMEVLDTVAGVTAKILPQPGPSAPPDFVRASTSASGDGQWIFGVAEADTEDSTGATLHFRYHVPSRQIGAIYITTSPPLGPRAISVNQDGSAYLAGWGLCDRRGVLLAQFRNASGEMAVGGHAFDSVRGVIYAQVPEAQTSQTPPPQAPGGNVPSNAPAPVLAIVEADNLAVRERLKLAENLAGKAVLSSDRKTMYALSASGLAILPVGTLDQAPRVAALQEDVLLRGSLCERRVVSHEIDIVNPGGGATDFKISTAMEGLAVEPAGGVTPAKVRVWVDMNRFQTLRGTVAGLLNIESAGAVNLPPPVRVLINNREPDQRGTIVNVPGKLVDLLADPFRDRFYILRQDNNQVLVFRGSDFQQIATLRTGNTPTQMALSFDGDYLLVANDDSQIITVWDLNRMQQAPAVAMPPGHYARSIASSSTFILAASRVVGPAHTIDVVNLFTRQATTLPSLGVWENKIHLNTMLTAMPSGAAILAAMADGNLLLFSAAANNFTVWRKDFTELAGPYAASDFDQFVVGNSLLNPSLVPVRKLETDTGAPSGFAFVDGFGIKTNSAAATVPGVVQRLDLARGDSLRPTRMLEAALLGQPGAVFTRTLAPLADRGAIISLTISGFTVLPWNYDAPVPTPRLERVVNAADRTEAVAAGGLVVVEGSGLSPLTLATSQLPLPTALGESCLTLNGVLVPMFSMSATAIQAQLPPRITGNATLILRTPAASSNELTVAVQAAAPSVFRSGVAGPLTGLPTVFRVSNGQLVTLSNPIHPDEAIVIYATGLGRTWPAVEAGVAAPADPLAAVTLPAEVDLGGVSLPVLYAGLVPGLVGVYQINAMVPTWAPAGLEVPLVIRQGGNSTALMVRVVK